MTSIPTRRSCRWARSSAILRRGPACRGHEAKREARPLADVDAIGARTASRLLEEAARESGLIAVAAPVRLVVTGGGQEHRAFARSPLRKELTPGGSHDCDAVEAVRERAPHELAREGWMAAPSQPDGEMRPYPAGTVDRFNTGLSSQVGPSRDDVELASTQGLRCAVDLEAENESVEIGRVRSPIAGVPDERESLPAFPPFDEEGTARDWLACLRVVDPVPPEVSTPEVVAAKRVPGKDDPEQALPAGSAGVQHDSHVLALSARTLRTVLKWYLRSASSLSGGTYLRIAVSVNTKSRAVIGIRSLHRASGRMW
jgi:hypothetical protein